MDGAGGAAARVSAAALTRSAHGRQVMTTASRRAFRELAAREGLLRAGFGTGRDRGRPAHAAGFVSRALGRSSMRATHAPTAGGGVISMSGRNATNGV